MLQQNVTCEASTEVPDETMRHMQQRTAMQWVVFGCAHLQSVVRQTTKTVAVKLVRITAVAMVGA